MKGLLVAPVLLCWILPAYGQPLSPDERMLVLEMLNENSARFLTAIGTISDAQWRYKPSPDS